MASGVQLRLLAVCSAMMEMPTHDVGEGIVVGREKGAWLDYVEKSTRAHTYLTICITCRVVLILMGWGVAGLQNKRACTEPSWSRKVNVNDCVRLRQRRARLRDRRVPAASTSSNTVGHWALPELEAPVKRTGTMRSYPIRHAHYTRSVCTKDGPVLASLDGWAGMVMRVERLT